MKDDISLKQPPSRKLTIVIVRKFGRLSSHEISGFWFVLTAIIFVLLVAAVVYLSYDNQSLRTERRRLLAQLILPSTDLLPEKPVVLTKEAPTTTEEPTVSETASTTSPTTTASSTTNTTTTTTAPTTTTTTLAQDETEERLERVAITNVKISHLAGPKGIRLAYHLENKSEKGRKLSGYTLAVAKNESADPAVLKPYPNKVVLKDGQPVNYKRGVYFSINHFKPFTGRIYSETGFTHLDIMVYDQRGDLLLSRTFEVTN